MRTPCAAIRATSTITHTGVHRSGAVGPTWRLKGSNAQTGDARSVARGAARRLRAGAKSAMVRLMSSAILLARSARTGPASALALLSGLLLLLRLART